MVGNEDLDEELGEDEYFGFGVDAGMGCVADIQTCLLYTSMRNIRPVLTAVSP